MLWKSAGTRPQHHAGDERRENTINNNCHASGMNETLTWLSDSMLYSYKSPHSLFGSNLRMKGTGGHAWLNFWYIEHETCQHRHHQQQNCSDAIRMEDAIRVGGAHKWASIDLGDSCHNNTHTHKLSSTPHQHIFIHTHQIFYQHDYAGAISICCSVTHAHHIARWSIAGRVTSILNFHYFSSHTYMVHRI